MTDFIIVQTSSNSLEGAQKIADAIIEKRLAGACWVSGPVTSTYRWEGKVDQEQEWVCSFKTRAELFHAVEQVIKAVHTYEIPEIVATAITAANQDFLDWVTRETQQETQT